MLLTSPCTPTTAGIRRVISCRTTGQNPLLHAFSTASRVPARSRCRASPSLVAQGARSGSASRLPGNSEVGVVYAATDAPVFVTFPIGASISARASWTSVATSPVRLGVPRRSGTPRNRPGAGG